MDTQEYKAKKLDKLTRDAVKLVSTVGSFGYGDVVDAIVKGMLTNHLISLINLNSVSNVDMEILAQSVVDDLTNLSDQLVTKINLYEVQLQENSDA